MSPNYSVRPHVTTELQPVNRTRCSITGSQMSPMAIKHSQRGEHEESEFKQSHKCEVHVIKKCGSIKKNDENKDNIHKLRVHLL